ncbi:MAG: T9SS type A sorting domain-containing protein [Bacteroidetes bacterium]|nr:T9SS type A sorting domain-containing protein [Bacteroidota bacterium]
MKKILHFILWIVLYSSTVQYTNNTFAQCSGGRSPVSINWDLQYYNNSNLPGRGINFMLGKNTMTLNWSSNPTFYGVVDDHTGSSLIDGNDLRFDVQNGTVYFDFLEPVENLKFTVYDIDNRQTFRPTAVDEDGNPLNITLTRLIGSGGNLQFNGTTTPSFYYSGSGVGNYSIYGAVVVEVSGLAKSVDLGFTRSASGRDRIYISDIDACTNSTWATDYQAISAPETGQPTHMLVGYDNSIYVVNKLDNTAMELFTDSDLTRLNTIAYDPYKQIIYYCDSWRNAANKSVYKYDVKTGVKSTFISDVNDFGIQTFAQGLATSGAGFYDGYLFIGTDSDLYPNTPTAIYRIDINPTTGAPIRASRFWGAKSAESIYGDTYIRYDWADFVVNDGILYNLNSAQDVLPGTEIEHFDLNSQTKLVGRTYHPLDTMSQASLDYEGNIFIIRQGFYYQQYNKTTGVLGPKNYYSGIDASKVLTDGAESFKYPYDYGDAPTSYGYASHIFRVNPNLMIGANVDYEMSSYYSTDALADDDDITRSGNDEDGVDPSYFISDPLTTSNASYTVPVKVTNHTGANAYLYGYIDYNRDGDFNDPGERSQLRTIPNATPTTTYNVTWVGLTGGDAGPSYIRFRLASNSSEISSGSGYARSGEVEDYPIPINGTSLPVELVSLTAEALPNNTTDLKWTTASEHNNDYFEVQRSTDGTNWITLGTVDGNGNSAYTHNYTYNDEHPESGINYYRLKQVDFDGAFKYTFVVEATFDLQEYKANDNQYVVYPNPTSDVVWVKSDNTVTPDNPQQISLYNVNGDQVYSSTLNENKQQVDMKYYSNGMYYLKIGKQSYKIVKQ